MSHNQELINHTIRQMEVVSKHAAKAELLAFKMGSDSMRIEAERQYDELNRLHRVYAENTGEIWNKQGVS